MVSLGTLEKKGKVIKRGRLFIVDQKQKIKSRDLNLHQLVVQFNYYFKYDKRQDMV